MGVWPGEIDDAKEKNLDMMWKAQHISSLTSVLFNKVSTEYSKVEGKSRLLL